MNKVCLTVLCSQAEVQAFVDLDVVLCLLLVFIVKVIGSYGFGHTAGLFTQLSQLFFLLDALHTNTNSVVSSLSPTSDLNSRY